ncbi:MFS transporter [Corynebacterium atypicum]|uniref:MFS transporter n=1 Tax=Corynebacterium atypicum TaxID=191610 RepID=A0ABM5QMS0_9CORY|nr:transcription antitermination factor NusB [Corynebacterium atypicum]AIG64080.1 MFS transporter [Corynebacterium atypicum]
MSPTASSGGFRSRSKKGRAASAHRGQRPQDAHRQHGPGRARTSRPGRGAPTRDIRGVDKPRQAAYATLRKVTDDAAYGNLTLPHELRARNLSGRDAAFATEITYGTLRHLGVLDEVVRACSNRLLENIAPEVLDALRLGIYQVLFTRVEPHAAVDTTVNLVGASGEQKLKGFANAIMRTVTRTPKKTWLEKLTPAGEMAAIAFRTAHPKWIADSFSRVIGIGELEVALAADSERPLVHLAALPGEITAEELALATGGRTARYSPYGVYLDGGDPARLEPVKSGLARVQDEGSQLIARALVEAPVEGEDAGRWLDLCAGPGGKAAFIGALARMEQAHLDAVEPAAHRAKLVETACAGLPVTVHRADGRASGLEAGFDRVLVDAPCSGLGALRRRPEARWRKQEADIPGLASLQFELLKAALELVRPGGVVVYSTCSPDVRETRQVVERAVRELAATEEDAHGLVAPMPDLGHEKSVQMWPHRHGTDAMFFAVLRRG